MDEPDFPIDTGKLRKFDRNLLNAGGKLAPRVMEHVPLCWFCESTDGTRSKEHIFPQWLLKHHNAMDERVHPIRVSLALGGGALASERGERPLRAHVNGEVCGTCNNGWMSALEVSATPVLTRATGPGSITDDEAFILARWFAKSAVNLNVSQPYRLLINKSSRHALAEHIPDRFSVHLFRVRKQNGVFDWVQKNPDTGSGPSDQIEEISRLISLTLVTHIRIADLVAIVIHTPDLVNPADVIPDGAVRIYPVSSTPPDWGRLPIHDDYLGPFTHVDFPAGFFD